MVETAEAADPIPVYPGQCFHAVMGARKFLEKAKWPQAPKLNHKFVRISEAASVPVRGQDGPRLEFQARKVEEYGSQELLTDDEKMWKAIKQSALRYGVSREEDNKEYDPLKVLNETSDLRVRWILKDLTPPRSDRSVGSPEVGFTNVVWDCEKVREFTSSNVSPTNDAEAAAQISTYAGNRSPGTVWWRKFEENVESALQPEILLASLRQTRAEGGDTAPYRTRDEIFDEFRENRKQGK